MTDLIFYCVASSSLAKVRSVQSVHGMSGSFKFL